MHLASNKHMQQHEQERLESLRHFICCTSAVYLSIYHSPDIHARNTDNKERMLDIIY